MNREEEKLSELIAKVADICPHLADYWQATAIVESLGYTDGIIEREFGFADALALGQYIYKSYQSIPQVQEKPSSLPVSQQLRQEISIFVTQYFRSFVYTIPLIVVLVLGNRELQTERQLLPPQLTSLFTLATLASLITTGGFVQMISRRGLFYLGLGEKQQAQRVSISLLYLGIITTIICGFFGIILGFYQNLFTDKYLVIGAIYYLLISILWMLLALLSLQFKWGVPIVLLGLTSLFLVFNLGLDFDTVVSQILVMLLALIAVIFVLFFVFKANQSSNSNFVSLPRLSATIYLLIPYFCYGISYFSFIFLDRLVAGWSISPASGLIFAIDSDYQKAMDLALLNFLILVPLGEYLSYRFINSWYCLAKQQTPAKLKSFSQSLQLRYGAILVVTGLGFGLSTLLILGWIKPVVESSLNLTTVIGYWGYLFLVIGLLNALILFSLNQAIVVIRTFIPGLIVNGVVGYILASAIAVDYAAVGLLAGAMVVMILSTRKVWQTMQKPDYVYYLAGY